MSDREVIFSSEPRMELYCGDCREVLPGLTGVDAVVTDPPYGIGFAAQPTNYQRAAGMTPTFWDADVIDNLPGILKIGKTQVVWGGNYYPLPTSRGWLVWFKPDAPPSMGQAELCWTNQDRVTRCIVHSISATNPERVGHPTQKPLAVMLWTLQQIPRGSVLDPFMGSGTTGVACARLGRRFIGIEIDRRYFDIAVDRITEAREKAANQLPFPDPPRQESLFTEAL